MKPPRGLTAGIVGSGAGLAVLLAFASPGMPARAADQPATPAAKPASKFRFSLLPKSLQRRPQLDFHVITELTPEGRKLAPPTAAQPVYYIAQPGQFTQMGDNAGESETPPDGERLTRAMETALASGEYRKAAPNTPLPAIAVVFNYGSFARFSMQAHDLQDDLMLAEVGAAEGPLLRPEDRDTAALLSVVLSHKKERDEVLRRAGLIGGEKFAHDLAKALHDEALYRTGGDVSRDLGFNGVNGAGPFNLFMNTNDNLMMLVEDSFNGCYFVIASAFDYTAMRKGQRVLLWRTKMTVNSSGISMSESLPALVQAAGPHLGKEMPEAVTVSRRISRGGSVKLDELRVLETDVTVPGTPPPAGKQPADGQK